MLKYSILLPGIPVTSARGSLGWCSVVHFECKGKHILFDTGSYGDRQLLWHKLEKENVRPEDIDAIVVSHLHFDHFVNAEIFCDAQIFVHSREIEYVFSGEYIKSADPYVPISTIRQLKSRLILIGDGESVLPGLKVLLLPGHTPGTVGLYLEEEKVLFASDAVKSAWDFSRNEPPPAFYSKEQAIRNYERIREIARGVVPGHDEYFSIDHNGNIDQLNSTQVQLRASLYPSLNHKDFTIS
jgi:glyoxylase-like metal-dependent hydrolase (beta-lactamase superfamily II)